MNDFIKKIRYFLFRTEQRLPFIPDFRHVENILKVLLISLLFCILYTFAQIDKFSNFHLKFYGNLKIFFPYVIFQILMLISLSKIIKSIKPVQAIFVLIVANLFSLYFIHSIMANSLLDFFLRFDYFFVKMGLSLGILFFFLIYFDWREKTVDPANVVAKLSFLQAKMRPHFLFNTLNSAIALVKKDPDTARKMISNLSELLRVSIKEEDITSMYTIEEEINLCKKYLEIEKIRLGNRLEVKLDIEPATLQCKIPKLSLQPLAENGILHGIQNLEEGGALEINIKINLLKRVIIEIKNPIPNMIGRMKIEETTNHVSLSNLSERFQLYYKADVVFYQKKIDKFFYIYIEIPYLN